MRKYDKYYEEYYPNIDRIVFENHWNGKIQDLKNYCFKDLDECKWNSPESFDAHFAKMTEYLGSTIYWGVMYENEWDFIGYDLITIDGIGISEDSYSEQQPYFFNKDKSRWFSLEYVINHLINKRMKRLKSKQLEFDFNQDQLEFDFNQDQLSLAKLN